MRRPSKDISQPTATALSSLAAKIEARVLTVVMMSVSSGIALVAMSFAFYAQMSTWFSRAAAAALTTLAFAAVTLVIGLVGAALMRGRARRDAARVGEEPGRLAKASPFIEVAGIGLVTLAKILVRQRRR